MATDVVAGQVAGLWRYPVKSMGGERVSSSEIGADGVEGDREWAFETDEAPAGMLRVSGRQRRGLLGCTARGLGQAVRVRLPDGLETSIEDPQLPKALGISGAARLVRSAVPQTDCRPLSLVSLETIAALQEELGRTIDARQFRANFYVHGLVPWGEDALVGRHVRLGTALLEVTERDPRCRFFSLNPQTAKPMPELMKLLDRRHQGRAGVYARVVRAGTVAEGDLLTVPAIPG